MLNIPSEISEYIREFAHGKPKDNYKLVISELKKKYCHPTCNYNCLYKVRFIKGKFIRNKISIVMLTYNRLDITINCLESYLKCLDNEYIEELIIFDNNSDLDLIHFLYEFQKKHSKIKIFLSFYQQYHNATFLMN